MDFFRAFYRLVRLTVASQRILSYSSRFSATGTFSAGGPKVGTATVTLAGVASGNTRVLDVTLPGGKLSQSHAVNAKRIQTTPASRRRAEGGWDCTAEACRRKATDGGGARGVDAKTGCAMQSAAEPAEGRWRPGELEKQERLGGLTARPLWLLQCTSWVPELPEYWQPVEGCRYLHAAADGGCVASVAACMCVLLHLSKAVDFALRAATAGLGRATELFAAAVSGPSDMEEVGQMSYCAREGPEPVIPHAYCMYRVRYCMIRQRSKDQ